MALRWRLIILIWLMGVLAAGEFGKVAPLIPSLRDHLQLDLAQAGWLASLIELGRAGWSGVAVAILALSLLSFAFMSLAERVTRRRAIP